MAYNWIMLATSTARKTRLWSVLHGHAIPGVVLLYQIVGLAMLAIAPILALRWVELPFIGAFTEQTLVVNTVSPSRASAWVVHQSIPEFGYRFAAIDGVELHSTADMQRELGRRAVGDVVMLTFKSPNGTLITRQSLLQRFPFTDRLAFFVLPYLIGLVYLASSIWVFSLRRWDVAGRAFSLFATSVAIAMICLFDLYTTHRLSAIWTAAVAFSGGSLLNLALVFPNELRIVERYPFLRRAGLFPAILLASFGLVDLYDFSNPLAYAAAWRWEYIFCGLAFVIFIASTIYRTLRSLSPMVVEQTRLILWGIAASFGFLAIWFFATAVAPDIPFTPLLLLPTIVFPVVNAYVILRYRVLKADAIFSRMVLYSLLAALTSVGYALIVGGLGLLVTSLFPDLNSLVVGISIFIFALLFDPLRSRLQGWVDRIFDKGRPQYREALQTFSRELTQAFEFAGITQMLRSYIEDNFHPAQVHIFIHDALSDTYLAAAGETGHPTSDLRFSAYSPLIQTLARRKATLFLGESRSLPAALQNEKSRLALLGVQLFIPLPGRKSLAGWVGLGARRSGEPYSHYDLSFLETLGDQVALALERAQVVSNLERRMHEMNIFTRIAQGINVTVEFDDILELIYAQTTQLVPCTDFHIRQHDNNTQQDSYVFYLEDNERLRDRENRPFPPGLDLETEVMNTRHPLVTDDYERLCRSKSFQLSRQGLFSWAGVPLNAGANTIGVLSLASRDSGTVYTAEQIQLLQAVADQAAGAIVKAQLFREAQQRTQQLLLLNEVARGMTSTLDLQPLLNQILQSAVSILNCEAGSLLLVDQTSDELVFEVVVGPVAGDLQGKRLQPGTGLVGKAVETRQPIIANDARHRKEWFDADQKTGFVTHDLLVVPMQIKDRVIGVIEVINKKDGQPFLPGDRDLLYAFTGQAAVAIENARLYTLTDTALNARVEELSVMQRIDRELNTSLNVDRAMQITLSWATRQSQMEAGLVGLIEERGLRLAAVEGIGDENALSRDSYLALDLPAMRLAVETAQPQDLEVDPGKAGARIVKDARRQVAIPIRRENKVIGLIYLETAQAGPTSEESLAFLSRLSDHAAIAIANAQYYAAIEAANLAKSEFISFVSHELKTPMTSIKGFTDLVASGVVGPVNETQANFLSTIRSNVDRMATLVSDLADVSRIEAGRLKLEHGAIPVSEVVEEVERSVRRQIEEKQQTLTLDLPDDLLPMWGDRVRLIQILTNLMSNAIKYSPQGGKIRLRARVAENQWAAGAPQTEDRESGPKVIHISVKDTGYGIHPDDQKKIFQKFFRSEDQNIRDAPGTGLGLNITKTLVEMQGGAIWFDSQSRKGATFHFTIPIAEKT